MTLRSKTTVPLALGFALAAAACSLLASPEKGAIKCDVSEGSRGSKDPCPGAMTCVDKVCKTVPAVREEDCEDRVDNDGDDKIDEYDDSVEERCDKKDNDCDGETDEGFANRVEYCDTEDNNCNGKTDEESDQDDDGFTSCGDKDKQMEPDCEPMQAAAHPGAKEICDGLDNDCDGTEDNSPSSLCPNRDEICLQGRCVRKTCAVEGSGETCKTTERCVEDKCVPMDCATPCGTNQFCDLMTTPPTCKEIPQQRKIGDSCTVDDECQSRLCIDSEALNLATPRRVCGKPCCSDSQCGPGESCYAASTGARSCLPRTMIANTYPAGSKACNAITMTNDAGVVVPQCAAPQVCAVETVTQAPSGTRIATSLCRTPSALALGTERPVAEACTGPTTCSTRLCQPLVFSSVCTTPCNVSSDCAKLAEYQTIAPVHGYCQYVDYGEYSASPGINYGPMCFVTADEKPTGAPMKECRSNAECPDLTCIGFSALMNKQGKCAPTCCEDAQCKIFRANARCVPVARGARRYEMRCLDQP